MCRTPAIITTAVCLAFASAGCTALRDIGKKPPLPTIEDIPPTTRVSQEQPISLPPQEDRPVKVGSLPLVYLLEHPGQIRVIDTTSGVVVATTRAGGRTILKVAADGVSIGGKIIRSAALDETHQYEIYLTNSADNFRRSTFERR